MSLPNTNERFSVQLTSTKDWRGWNDTFIMKARNLDLWDQHIKPSSQRLPWLTAPQLPRMSDFEQIPHVRTRNPRRNDQNGEEDESAILEGNQRRSDANQTRLHEEEGRDNDDESDQYYDPENDIMLSNLTETGKADYHAAMSRYKIQKDAYQIQAKSVLTLSNWVYDTVAPHLRKTCCRPQKTLVEWYAALKPQVGSTSGEEDEEARDKYRQAVKPLIRHPKDMRAWLTAWEEAFIEAVEMDVPDTFKSVHWWRDFTRAVSGIGYEAWCQSYQIQNQHRISGNRLSYRDVSNAFAYMLAGKTTAAAQARKPIRGGFATYAGLSTDHTDVDTDADEPKEQPQRRARRQTPPRGTSKRRSSDSSRKGCKACGQESHSLSNCFYVFPHSAFEGFRFNQRTKMAVEEALRTDSSLKEEVERIRK
ncbi:hypothetical protein N657DRAFT_605287, partial [Parathielavia appendiculata]